MLEKWKEFQERLQASMKQEISTMRDMLANMRQEEASLLAGDKIAWNQIMIERSSLLSRLYQLRSERSLATTLLEAMAEEAALPFDNFLCTQDNCEILSMREQLMALVEKMNLQNIRNHTLEGREYGPICKDRCSYPPPGAPVAAKRNKTTIATYPDKP